MKDKALKHLSQDPVMKILIETHGEIGFDGERDLFEDLISSIVSQQLSTKAADTIWNRFTRLCKTPEEILATPDNKIRACGISYSKIKYIKGIAEAIINQQLIIANLQNLPDEEVIVELTKLKGVGKWTAEMFLIFSLQRPDIFSLGDLGLRNAVAKHYKVDRDDLKKIAKLSEKWQPYRSWASRYLWKSLG